MTDPRLVNEAFKQKLMNMKALDAATQLLEKNIAPFQGGGYESMIKSEFNLLGEETIHIASDRAEMPQQGFDITPDEQGSQVEKIKSAHRFLSKAQQYEFKDKNELEGYMAHDESYQQMVGKQYKMDPKLIFDAYKKAHENYLNPKAPQQKQEREEVKAAVDKVLGVLKASSKKPKSNEPVEQALINFLKKHEKRAFKDINEFIQAMKKDPEFKKLVGKDKGFKFRPDILFDAWKKHKDFGKTQKEDPVQREVFVEGDSEQAAFGVLASTAANPDEQASAGYAAAAAGGNTDRTRQVFSNKNGGFKPTGSPARSSSGGGLSGPFTSLVNKSKASSVTGVTDADLENANKEEQEQEQSNTPFSIKPKLKP